MNHFISVIIPTRSINDYIIKENLPAFTKQSYKDFEVIVLPNSKDKRDDELLKKYRWLRIIPTGKVTRPAEKRDIGVKYSKGDIVAFIDDDAFPSSNWLEQAMQVFDEEKPTTNSQKPIASVSVVCGPGVLPDNALYWEKVFDAVLKTWIGAGGYSYRFNPDKPRFVDDYPSMNFLIKKKLFEKVGGFHSEYWPGEDSKLCEDIVYKEKQKILYDPHVLVYHHRRNSLAAYLKQHSNYGYHRGAFFAHGDKNSSRIGYLIPSVFVMYIVYIILYSVSHMTHPERSIQIFYFIPLILYVATCLYVFLRTLIGQLNLKVAAGAAAVLFFTHVVYGILFIKGFFIGLTRHERIYK